MFVVKSLAGKRFGVLGICAAFVFGCAAIACAWIAWSFWNPESGDRGGLIHDAPIDPSQTESLELAEAGSTSSALSETAPASLEELTQIDSQFSRIRALYNFALGVDEADFLALIEQTENLPRRFQFEFQRVFVERFFEVNPELALSNVDSFHTTLVQNLFLNWAKRDLADAIARAQSLEGTTREAAAWGILSPYSEFTAEQRAEIAHELGREELLTGLTLGQQVSAIQRNPEKAWYEALQDDAYDSDHIRILVMSGATWIRHDGLEVVDEISASLGDVRVRDQVLASVLSTATQFADVEEIFSKALEIETGHDAKRVLLTSVVAQWSQLDPLSAIDTINEVQTYSLRNQLLETLVHSWAFSEPRTILDELDRIPIDMQATARANALKAIARSDSEEAIELAQSLEIGASRTALVASIASIWAEQDAQAALAWALNNQEFASGRWQLVSNVVTGWSTRDPTAALNWVLEQGENSMVRQMTIATILKNLTDRDPALALQRALEQPIEEGRSGLEHTVISHMAQIDLERAKEMLKYAREGETRRSSHFVVAWALVGASRGIEALELANNLVDWEREEYISELLSHWAWDDTVGLQDSLGDISDPEIRASAEAALEAQSDSPSNPPGDYWE